MRIGRLANDAGVGISTLRYYERRGLLRPVARTRSGYREFPPASVERIRLIRHAQRVGFSLEEIRVLLSLRDTPGVACEDVSRAARATHERVRERIRALRAMERELQQLLVACGRRPDESLCPIFELLSTGD
ncbi:MAG: heavy metal-responsive transcriptional regulator [Gemmatimonadaceae bacterium]